MDPELKVCVHDDLEELSNDAKGGITTFRLMAQHMVLQSQEIIDGLLEWIRSFDIRNYDGKNVSIAIGCCKAVIRALESYGLPPNTAHNFLDGFANASTPEFVQLCVMLGTTQRLNVLQSQQQASMSVKKKCFAMFIDLVMFYIESKARRKWRGAKHDGQAFELLSLPIQTSSKPMLLKVGNHSISGYRTRTATYVVRNVTSAGTVQINNKQEALIEEMMVVLHVKEMVIAVLNEETMLIGLDEEEMPATNVLADINVNESNDAQGRLSTWPWSMANGASSSDSEKDDALPRAHDAVANDGNKSNGDSSCGSLAAHAARMYASLKG